MIPLARLEPVSEARYNHTDRNNSVFSGQSLATSNAKGSAIWSRTQSGESKRPNFCPTVAFASPRTPAPAVPTLVCVWEGGT
jgi:hypothetical protein